MESSPINPMPSVADTSATLGKPSLLLRTFNGIFTRHALNVALLVLVVIFMAGRIHFPEEQLHDPDIWWHIVDARILVTTHHFIHIEPYSFAVAGERWIAPEWLSEVPYWLGYQTMGLVGVYMAMMLAIYGNMLFLYWRSYWKTNHASAAFWSVIPAILLMIPNIGPRTILYAYLAMSAELAILEAVERGKTQLLWLLPPLFCLWINLHGSWLIGIGLLVLYILCGIFPLQIGVFEQQAFTGKERGHLLWALGLSLVALLVNPYGWRLVWNPLDMIFNQKLNIKVIQEWQPLSFNNPTGITAVVVIFFLIVINCISGRKWKLYELAFLFFAWFAAFDHFRFTFLASVITMPFVASDVARVFFGKPDEKTIPAMNALIAAGIIGAVAYYFPTNASLQKGLAVKYPLHLIASIQPSWRTFHTDILGGMMILNSKPTFMDSRIDTFEHHGVLRDYVDVARFHEPLKILDKYCIDHLLIGAEDPLTYLIERIPGWRIEGQEGTGKDAYLLFAKTNSTQNSNAGCVTHPR